MMSAGLRRVAAWARKGGGVGEVITERRTGHYDERQTRCSMPGASFVSRRCSLAAG